MITTTINISIKVNHFLLNFFMNEKQELKILSYVYTIINIFSSEKSVYITVCYVFYKNYIYYIDYFNYYNIEKPTKQWVSLLSYRNEI